MGAKPRSAITRFAASAMRLLSPRRLRRAATPPRPAASIATCRSGGPRTSFIMVVTDHLIQRNKPAGDLLADIAERHEDSTTSYQRRGGAVLSGSAGGFGENRYYLALAQVRDGANLEKALPAFEKALEALAFASARTLSGICAGAARCRTARARARRFSGFTAPRSRVCSGFARIRRRFKGRRATRAGGRRSRRVLRRARPPIRERGILWGRRN